MLSFAWPPNWWPFGPRPIRPPAPLPHPPAPPPAPPDPLGPAPFALEILDAHNAERAKHGLTPLAHNAVLQGIANGHAHVMAAAGILSHDAAGDGSFGVRLTRSGYHFAGAGENVAEGQPDIPSVMASWLSSPGHRANVLGAFTEAGFQVALDPDGRPYWCADFGRPGGS